MTKTKKIIIFMLAVMCMLTFGGSVYCYARYVFELGNEGPITPGSDLPVSVNNRVEVYSQEMLFEALQGGYPYITIGETVSSPLVITEKTMKVKESLILDINGKEIQRIGESAMLEIEDGVTLTIIDTSEGQKGNLYNPVGTVLEVNGGTLDVRAGKFESGPRTWEYYSNAEIRGTADIQGRISTHQKVNYVTRNKGGTENESVIDKTTKKLPIVKPNIVKEGGENGKLISIDGNIYYDIGYPQKNSEAATLAETEALVDIEALADTYCFYNTSDNFSTGQTVPFDQTAADFSYYYYAYPYHAENPYGYLSDTEKGVQDVLGADAKLNKDYVLVTVYGFRNVIQTAMGFPDGCLNGTEDIGKVDTGRAPYYAAVKMSGGNITINCDGENANLKAPQHKYDENGVRTETSPDLRTEAETGSFISYFGVETTACVYFTGGVTSIKTKGAFATVDPKVIKEDIKSTKAFSSEGRGICVYGGSQGGGGVLDIDGGHFYAYNHNIVRMEQGKIDVDGDSKAALQLFKVHRVSFYKDYKADWTFDDADKAHPSGKGGIYSGGGEVDIGVARLYMTSGRLPTDVNALHTYTSKQGVYGVYSTGGKVIMKDVDIYIRGQSSVGVSVSGGGTVEMGGSTPTKITTPEQEAQRDEIYKDFSPEIRNDIKYLYQSNIFVIGYNTKGVLVQSGEGSSVSSVKATNTAIFVSRAQGTTLPTTFISGVDVINGDATFNNCRIQSDGYGITMTRGQLLFSGSRLSAYNASAIILGGGSMVINDSKAQISMDTTTIHCKLTKDYINRAKKDGFVGNLHTASESKQFLYTFAGIDIIGGKLSVQSGQLDYTFDSDKETPETKDRIDETLYTNGIYNRVYNSSGEEIGAQCMGPNGFLPAASSAVRVIGSGASGSDIGTISLENALEIKAKCTTITSNMGGGITIRGGSVVLGSDQNEEITVRTLGKESYGKKLRNGKEVEQGAEADYFAYRFAGKDNWEYLDNKTGGDAMFVSGGSVTANTSKLTLEAAHGNGLFVTGSGCIKKWYEKYNGEDFNDYLFTYSEEEAAINPEVTVNCGTFEGRCDGFAKNTGSWKPGLVSAFNFTGPSSYYGVKVVCGGKLSVNGGNILGYGGICTMGATKGSDELLEKNKAHLNLTADYSIAANRITVSSVGADAGGFYNNSLVTIKSTDKKDALVKVATQEAPAAPETLTDFGLIVNGKNTCFVIEKYRTGGGSTVSVNGGFYCAKQGDENGGKAFWCDNDSADLTIQNGWFVGNKGGGAIQGNLRSCKLEGGYFINDCVVRGAGGAATSVFTGYLSPTLGNGKTYYQLNASGKHYALTQTAGSTSDSAIYVQ